MIVEEALFTVAPGDEDAFEAVFEKAAGHFFVDDQTTNGEQGPGGIAWLQVWDRPQGR